MKDVLPKNYFQKRIEVAESDIDGLHHVNNVVYLKWMIQSAIEHCEALGFTFETFREYGGVFVVRRHEIDYIKPALLGDRLTMYTWSDVMDGTRARRIYRLLRESDQKIILEAETHWVFVNPASGKPVAIPQTLSDAFKPN